MLFIQYLQCAASFVSYPSIFDTEEILVVFILLLFCGGGWRIRLIDTIAVVGGSNRRSTAASPTEDLRRDRCQTYRCDRCLFRLVGFDQRNFKLHFRDGVLPQDQTLFVPLFNRIPIKQMIDKTVQIAFPSVLQQIPQQFLMPRAFPQVVDRIVLHYFVFDLAVFVEIAKL